MKQDSPPAVPYLFLDDSVISEQQGLARRMGAPSKFPNNPILKPERPWEGICVIMWGSVIWDWADNLFKPKIPGVLVTMLAAIP